MKKTIYLATVCIFTLTFSIFPAAVKSSYAHGGKKHVSAEGNVTYTKSIKPLFKKNCSKCHGSKSPVHMEFVKDVKKYTKMKKT